MGLANAEASEGIEAIDGDRFGDVCENLGSVQRKVVIKSRFVGAFVIVTARPGAA